ncbi:MAG: MotA/TolQ/ExbB proton channel family protein [Clostridia bacterium]|jgi:chemotaxis protein MotA|nr:MotA/TolQ/ExbB proton channel family protein [Clostridia bacterium]
MDFATIIGAILGVALIVISILLEGSLLTFWSFSSVMIVVGGVVASTLINYPLKHVLGVLKITRNAFQTNTFESLTVIKFIVGLAEKARREGLLALEEEADNSDDEFIKKGIHLIVDGTDPELVRNILQAELLMMEERHKVGYGILDAMGLSAPAYGMLGTLIGLILMLKNLNDPSTLGPSMAVALITTFYGSLMANLIFIPIAGKLKLRSSEEIMQKEIIIEGVLSIQAGENPRIVAEKMKTFLTPEEKELLEEDRKKGQEIE